MFQLLLEIFSISERDRAKLWRSKKGPGNI